MAAFFTTLFIAFVFGLAVCGAYAIFRCIQQNISRAREAQMQGTHVAPENSNVQPQLSGADANTGVLEAGADQAGPEEEEEEEAFQMPEISEVTMIRIEGPNGVFNLATWDKSRARVEP